MIFGGAIMDKNERNAEYLRKLERGIEQVREGSVIVKTMDELEAMANETPEGEDMAEQ